MPSASFPPQPVAAEEDEGKIDRVGGLNLFGRIPSASGSASRQ
jgi:hypothetical protein